MIELRSDPYVLKPRLAPPTESDFRVHLNIGWCRGVLFNVVALKNSVAIVEYDAILWSEDSVMFVEYKDSVAAYKSLSARRIQQMDSLAKNIARGLGYRRYCFVIVVKDLQEITSRGGVDVIPLYLLEATSRLLYRHTASSITWRSSWQSTPVRRSQSSLRSSRS